MISMPKDSPFRSHKLLRHAEDAPMCFACGKANVGDVVACHSNLQRHGKGLGQKASDLTAFMCGSCHDRYDGRVSTRMSQDDFNEALISTTLWLLKEGYLVAK